MALKTNQELWDALRAQDPNFANHTSKGTADMFTERGFAALASLSPNALSDFFQLTIRIALQQVNISHAKDPLAAAGIGETYDMGYGGIIQRMATYSVKPTTPRFKGLKDGDWVNRWTVRKPKTAERFFNQNFDYQSFLTLQEDDMKQIFLSPYGMSEYIAGILQGLENGYVLQRYENKLETINAGIHDTTLQPAQVVEVTLDDWNDPTQMTSLLYSISSVLTAMKTSAQTGAFNALKYPDVQDMSRLRLLVRAGFSDSLRIYTLAGTYNPEKLDIGVDYTETQNFGGITYVKSSDHATPVYPAYDKETGEMIGYADTAGQTTAAYDEGSAEIEAKDPNADVLAVLMDKGWLFEAIQNSYTVRTTPLNEAGLYMNYWASAKNNAIKYDRLYNFVVFKKASEAA